MTKYEELGMKLDKTYDIVGLGKLQAVRLCRKEFSKYLGCDEGCINILFDKDISLSGARLKCSFSIQVNIETLKNNEKQMIGPLVFVYKKHNGNFSYSIDMNIQDVNCFVDLDKEESKLAFFDYLFMVLKKAYL